MRVEFVFRVLALCLAAGSLGPALASETFGELAARAAAAARSADPKSAIPLYESALRLQPEWKEGLWMLGSLLYESEDYRQAATVLRRLVSLAPSAGHAWAILGLSEYENRAFSEALRDIQQGLKLGIGDNEQMVLVTKFHEAALLTKFGQFDAALGKYSEFMSGQITDQQGLIGLGLLSLRRPLAPVEVIDSKKAFYLEAGRAFSALLSNDQARASDMHKKLAEQSPDDPDIHYAYGYCIFGKDPDRAIEQWRRALELEPSHAAAHALLAWALFAKGQRQTAVEHAKTALTLDPNLAVAQIVVGRAMAESGQVAPAVEHLERAAQLQPRNLEAHLALATAYSEAGRRQDAQRERQLCLEMQAGKSVAQP